MAVMPTLSEREPIVVMLILFTSIRCSATLSASAIRPSVKRNTVAGGAAESGAISLPASSVPIMMFWAYASARLMASAREDRASVCSMESIFL